MNKILKINEILNHIYTIRGVQVMLDRDLAKMYQVDTKILNRAVKRNINRFPDKFRFQITKKEFHNLRSHIDTSSEHGGRRYLPYVFTEQGVSMLSAILRSDVAIEISIQIINAFVEMRKFIATNAGIFQRIDKLEQKQIKTDEKFEQIFKALENKSIKPKQGIFYDVQIFDAYVFVANLIKEAKKSIILIDNYIDETVLNLFAKKILKSTRPFYHY